jgi:anti-sigma regulatory factor (Ser/Thr protein kinase)
VSRLEGDDAFAADRAGDGDRAGLGQRAVGVDVVGVDVAGPAGLHVQVLAVRGRGRIDGACIGRHTGHSRLAKVIGACMTVAPAARAAATTSAVWASMFVFSITSCTAPCNAPPSEVNSFWYSMSTRGPGKLLFSGSAAAKDPSDSSAQSEDDNDDDHDEHYRSESDIHISFSFSLVVASQLPRYLFLNHRLKAGKRPCFGPCMPGSRIRCVSCLVPGSKALRVRRPGRLWPEPCAGPQEQAPRRVLVPGDCPVREPSFPPGPGAVSLRFTADLAAVRALVRRCTEEVGLTEKRAIDLVIAVAEVAANTVHHARTAGTLDIWHDAHEIICQITDGGFISDPLAGSHAPPPGATAGHGLWLVNQVCDRVALQSDETGTTIRMHMNLKDS